MAAVGIIFQGTLFPQKYFSAASEQRQGTSSGAAEASWAVLQSHCTQSVLRKILLSCKANKTRKKLIVRQYIFPPHNLLCRSIQTVQVDGM